MATTKDTLWDKFLAPVVGLLMDKEEMNRYAQSVDWEKESANYRRGDVVIPEYYSSQNFRGIEGGYLNSGAAVTYDPITQYVLPPNETWVRQALIDAVKVKPRRILDLGCGTGSTTLMLKQAFGEAEVIGLDLSPYMLVRAGHKAQSATANILWRHGNAQKTGFAEASFDLVTAALLFHETPTDVTKAILRESFRLLKAGGQILVLDGNQKFIHQVEWLNNVFEEPYIRDYSAGNMDVWLGEAGFEAVFTQDIWLMHQVSGGVKPIPVEDTWKNLQRYTPSTGNSRVDNGDLEGFPSPA